MNKVLLTLTFLFLGTSSAIAVNLANKDSDSYEVRVTENGRTTNTSIDAATFKGNICSSDCKIEVIGVGTMQADQGETVVIQNGTLTK